MTPTQRTALDTFLATLTATRRAAFLDAFAGRVEDIEGEGMEGRVDGFAFLRAVREATEESIAASAHCHGALAYVQIGGMRLHTDGRYKYRCLKCGETGTNDGHAREHNGPPAGTPETAPSLHASLTNSHQACFAPSVPP